jgi:hypothetical protein
MTGSRMLDPRIIATLDALAPASSMFRDPWWIIGSCALHLSGMPGIVPHDLDLLTSTRDADALVQSLADQIDEDYHPADRRFDSRFASFPTLPMPVEVMGDLRTQVDSVWQAITIGSSLTLQLGGHDVKIPTLPEQLRLLELFGRDKDLAKAASISLFLQEESTDVR